MEINWLKICGLFVCLLIALTGTVRPGWSESSEGLTLTRAYRLALEQNDRINALREQVRQSEADVTIASSGLLPQVELEATALRQKEGPAAIGRNEDNLLGEATLTQHIYQGGKVWLGRSLARLRRQSKELAFFRGVQQVLFSVANQFFNVELARQQVEISKNTRKRSQKQLERARGRYEVGASTRTPVLRSKVQLSRARQQLEEAKNTREVALSELALEIGVSTDPVSVNAEVEASAELDKLESYFTRAYRERRDYKRARKKLETARQQVERHMADRYPSVKLRATGNKYDKDVQGMEEDWQVMGVLSYPLFSGGKDEAEVDKAQSAYREAKENLERLQKRIRVQVKEAYLDIQTQGKVVNTLKDQVASAKENHVEVAARFEEGLADAVDVSDAITVLNEAELRLARARIARQLAHLRLKLATGSYEQDLVVSAVDY